MIIAEIIKNFLAKREQNHYADFEKSFLPSKLSLYISKEGSHFVLVYRVRIFFSNWLDSRILFSAKYQGMNIPGSQMVAYFSPDICLPMAIILIFLCFI